ncbi:MAG: phosphoribosylformylglycinamidine synthase subunit PurQ [Patescibacteria group bacterium]|nr:phosphoribosylformylglycinamidine synthase subunit PurQ [Patescibacteria group bacterium]
MTNPKAIILSGYGLNCEEETAFAFQLAGAKTDIVHINDLIAGIKKLANYQILAVPGGFSYGDDTGSGKAYSNKLRNHLKEDLQNFLAKDKLAIGICNGFQILTNLNVVPGALTFNDNARYTVRWVDLKAADNSRMATRINPGKAAQAVQNSISPWLTGITKLSLPIAHGEGKFIADKQTLQKLKDQNAIAFTYDKGEICRYQSLPANPNGATQDIAGVLGYNGRVLGMMPHPERAVFFTQLPNWPMLKEKLVRANKPLPSFGPGLQIFKNAVGYFL